MKRVFDLVVSILGLVIASPILLPVMFLVWLQDKHSPFYVAERIGQNNIPFKMVKLRSMIINADTSGVDSTSADDRRITSIGHFIRRYKLDELTQLWNVLKGDMSIVGPRPNVRRETDLYTQKERVLLSVKPGVTDFSSIVFSDEGDILAGKTDPDLAYNQLIRPGKGLLGLFYISNNSFWGDIYICWLTFLAIVSRPTALKYLCKWLKKLGADEDLLVIAARTKPLTPRPPPGSLKVVTSRDQNCNI